MDPRPFFEFNMLDFTEIQVKELKRFTPLDPNAPFEEALFLVLAPETSLQTSPWPNLPQPSKASQALLFGCAASQARKERLHRPIPFVCEAP